MIKLRLIVATCDDMGIGINNTLPWKLRNEMKYFERMTKHTETDGKQNAVIMGRKTWQSIPLKYRPLKDRFNVVLSRQAAGEDFTGAAIVAQSLENAIQRLEASPFANQVESAWIIGGEQIYRSAIESNHCERIYLTRIKAHYECDTFFPEIPSDKFKLIRDPAVPKEVQCENDIEYSYEVYTRL